MIIGFSMTVSNRQPGQIVMMSSVTLRMILDQSNKQPRRTEECTGSTNEQNSEKISTSEGHLAMYKPLWNISLETIKLEQIRRSH